VTRYDQTDEHIDYVGTWDTFEKTTAYKTAYARANTKGASVDIYFNGTSLTWIAMKGTSTGKADVYQDGVFKKTIDLAATSAHYQVAVWSTGDLPSGLHKVTIARSASAPAGTFVTIDAVDVAGTLVYGPPAVTGLSPVSGSTAGGASVTISGTDFGAKQGSSKVAFATTAIAKVRSWSDTSIVVIVPELAPAGSGFMVGVTVGGKVSNLYAFMLTPTGSIP